MNRRILLIHLTPLGRERMRACSGVVAELEGLVEGGMSTGELTAFRDRLERAHQAVAPMARGSAAPSS